MASDQPGREASEVHPRVLVVGAEPFSYHTGTGITLSNLFRGWPADRLAQVHSAATPPANDVCGSFRFFPPRPAIVDRLVRRGRVPGRVAAGAGPAAPDAVRGGWRRLVHRELRAAADVRPLHVPRGLRSWAMRQQPDVIYSMLGSVRVMTLVRRLADVTGAPVVPHFMDDWPSTLYAARDLGGLGRWRLTEAIRQVVRRAPFGLCIGDEMAREYEERYGIRFTAFMNCVDQAAFDQYRESRPVGVDATGRQVVEFVYVGGLHLGRWESLARIGRALESAVPGSARLTVHAPERDLARYGDAFRPLSAVRLGHSVASAEVGGVLAGADVLVHVESFAPDTARYTRLSVSTKLPQYLAAGRPVLAHGPAELASMRHLQRAGAAVLVGAEEPTLLAVRIAQLCADPSLRQRLGDSGHAFAKLCHSQQQVAERFAAELARAARRS